MCRALVFVSAFIRVLFIFYDEVTCPGPKQGWKVIDVPVRDPAPNEVFIKVYASGLCASDKFVQDGTWPGLQYPRVPGHEVVGRVVATGSGIDADGRLKTGALVGVGWSGGYCNVCRMCRNGDFAGCVTAQYSGFTSDGGHGEYVYAPETGTYEHLFLYYTVILRD